MKVIGVWIAALVVMIGIGVGAEAGLGVGAPSKPPNADARAAARTKPTQFQVFLIPSVTPRRVAEVRAFLKQRRGVNSCRYLDHAQSFDLLKQVLKNDPQKWEGLSAGDVPPLFQCVYAGPNADLLAAQLRALPDVYAVNFAAHGVFSGPASRY